MPSTCSSSQTQRSLCESISTIWTRASSARAWNQRATRAGSGWVAVVMTSNVSSFLDTSRVSTVAATGQHAGTLVLSGAHDQRKRDHVLERVAFEAKVFPATDALHANQARGLQHFQMERHARLRSAEDFMQLRHAAFPLRQQLDDVQAGDVRRRKKPLSDVRHFHR